MVLAWSQVLSGHRGGAINRPYFLTDLLELQGLDPLPVLVALGGVVTVFTLHLLVADSSHPWSYVDVGLISLLLVALFAFSGLQNLKFRLDELRQQTGVGKPSGGFSLSEQQESEAQSGPIALVLFENEWQPESGFYYFRQATFSHLKEDKLVSGADDGWWSASTEAENLLSTRVHLMSKQKSFGLVDARKVGELENPDPRYFHSAYRVESRVLRKPWSELLELQPEQGRLEAPSDPRYLKLLEEIGVEPSSPSLKQAIRIKLWLERNCVASQRPEDRVGSVAEFLFDKRVGPGPAFVQAGAFLMRRAGLPARVASGYAAEAQRRGRGASLLLQGEDARSWIEVPLQGVGWVVLDLIPEKSLSPPKKTVHPELQKMMGELAQRPSTSEPGLQRDARFLLQDLGRALAVVWVCCLLLGFGIKLKRSRSTTVGGRYRAFLDRLAEVDLVRERGESREAFARRLAMDVPELSQLTRLYLRWHLRGGEPGEEFETLLESAHSSLKARCASGERLRGWLRPFSWMRVR